MSSIFEIQNARAFWFDPKAYQTQFCEEKKEFKWNSPQKYLLTDDKNVIEMDFMGCPGQYGRKDQSNRKSRRENN